MGSYGGRSERGFDSLIPIQNIINLVENSYNFSGSSIGHGDYQAGLSFDFKNNKDKSFIRKIRNFFMNTKNEKILEEINQYLIQLG